MKIAITSTGNSLDSCIDKHFGRCLYFVIIDTESEAIEIVPNPYKENVEGAGPASVQLLASRGVRKVISGEFGVKVKAVFDQHQIQLIVIRDLEKSIREIINLTVPVR